MAQRRGIWERSDRPGCWYTKIDRKRVFLGRSKDEAERNFHKLMLARSSATGVPEAVTIGRLSVGELFDRFLDVKRPHWSAANFSFNQIHLDLFAESIGRRKAADKVIPFDVEQWILAAGWTNPNTVGNAKRVVKSAFKWAHEMGLIERNPVAMLRKPTPTARDFVLDPGQQAEFLGLVRKNPPLRDAATFMLLTGARPQELRAVTAKEFLPAESVLFWPIGHAPKGRAERRIYLATDALAIVRRLAKVHQEGPLFRQPNGRPWTSLALSRAFGVVADQLNLPGLVPYTLRHTFATNALVNNVDPERLRILLGHRDISMVVRYYSKLDRRRDEMHAAAFQAICTRKVESSRRRKTKRQA